MRVKRLQGSFTVEAAFVLPILLFIIMMLLYAGLALHDEVVATVMIRQEMQRAQDDIRRYGKEAVTKQLREAIETKIGNKLCITAIHYVKVEIGLLTIEVTYDEEKRIGTRRTKQRRESLLIYDPMKYVRSIGEILNDASGV
ncbi:MAG: hypothetical protein PWP24_13 [Clostridiales bacterium]|nr:hypothetical protein [Clostridiales bacterium]